MAEHDDLRTRIRDLPPKRLALLALELQEELRREKQVRAARSEPIAVIGMACRFPGGSDSPDAYWQMLAEGRDAIVEVPADRWSADALYDPDPDAAGRIATRWGGYLNDVQSFDAAFFSISPREARAMDPQQRLLMEVTWRAFEDAGIPTTQLYGRRAGVFVGMCGNDYLMRLLKEGPESIDAYLSSGNAYSVAAGRLSFTFGFQGPAVTVDTACSSSLVALHGACESLRSGESEVAVAAGVNVMCSPETAIALSRARMMAPDGRCKTFDDAADGFVRAEGCGVLLLKGLSDAQKDGDRIQAVIRGTAVGQDGRSTGLTVPNGPAQEQVVRDALERSGLQPHDIDYVEAHGTGTSLGDPIEIRALGRVFGPKRDRPLYVGSVKTNMGHLESAAGVAGVIKAVLTLREGRIPPHLHFHTPSRRIEWEDYPIEVPADGQTLPDLGRPHRAGVSSFGFSGTNAHVIVEQAPPIEPAEAAERPAFPVEVLTVSGFTPEARDDVSRTYLEAIDGLAPDDFSDFCHTVRVGRTAFGWRRAIAAPSVVEMRAGLTGAEGAPQLVDGATKVTEPPALAFLFTGQGAQHPGMGHALYQTVPAFRAAIDRCAEILDPVLALPLRTALFEGEGDSAPLYQTSVAQPAVVAFEWSLSEMWRSWGVRPSAVLGHSLGEFVAACVAGVLSLEDALRLVAERGRLLESLPAGKDRMAAIFAPADVVEDLLAGDLDVAAIAAFNGPENTVVSGRADVVARVVEACAARGHESRELRLDRGFHSPRVEPILDALQEHAARIDHRPPTLPVAWNVTGDAGASTPPPDGYWREHARRPVRFMQGVRSLASIGIRHFLEVGPHPTLSPLVVQILEDEEPTLVPTLRRGGDACMDVGEAIARLWVAGVDVDFRAFDAPRRRVAVPGHPLTGERYWVDPPTSLRVSAPRGVLPGMRLSAAIPILETIFTPESPAFLAEHRFRGEPVVPGPVYIEAAREAARALGAPADGVIDLELLAPAIVGDAGLRLQTIVENADGQTRFRVASMPVDAGDGASWIDHARGTLLRGSREAPPSVAEQPGEPVSVADHLERLRTMGFDLGTGAACYDDLVVGSWGARARLVHPDADLGAPLTRALLMDAAVQVLGVALATNGPLEPRMLAGIGEAVWQGEVGTAVRCTATPGRLAGDGSVAGDVALLDRDGRVVAWLTAVSLRQVPGPVSDPTNWHHRLEWLSAPVPEKDPTTLSAAAVVYAGEQMERAWPELAREAGLPRYVESLADLGNRVAGHVGTALATLGLDVAPGDVIPRDLDERLGVTHAHRKLFARLLDILVATGVLVRVDGQLRVARPLSNGPADVHDGSDVVLALVNRCGCALAGVLSGQVDPLSLLFPDGAENVTRSIYRDTAFGQAFNGMIRIAVAAVAPDAGDQRPLRVLEVGAGSGSTTVAALAGLEGRPLRYTFTDVSPTLVRRAEAEFAGREGLEFCTLDLERDPEAQGIVPGSQDVVIAANVVHATDRVVPTLTHLRRMLAPGGMLVLLEGTRPEPWVDITFGLTGGWWRFADHELRPAYPLLPVDGWTAALGNAGFQNVRPMPSDGLAAGAGQVILLARRGSPIVRALDPESPLGRALAAHRDTEDDVDDVELVLDGRGRTAADVVRTMQQVLTTPGRSRLRVVTAHGQATDPQDTVDPSQAVIWGLARCFSLEHPERWGGILDVPAGCSDTEVAARLIDEVRNGGIEDQVAWRGTQRWVPRVVANAPEPTASPTVAAGTYVVTGGVGGLGLHVANWLAARGADRLVLLGRNATPADWSTDDPRHHQLATLAGRGVDVLVRSVDITIRESLERLLAEVRESGPPIRGVVHAAAVFDTTPLADLTPEGLAAVLAPKVLGAENLAAATDGDPLDFLVLFSSTTSILGVAGLASYAAANQYLDAFATLARARGRPVVSIAWGIWDEMRLASEEDRDRYVRAGLRPMRSGDALDAMGKVLVSGAGNAVVADVDWDRLRAVYEGRRRRPMLDRLRGSETSGIPAGPASRAEDGPAGLASLGPRERRDRLLELVAHQVRAVLRLPSDRLVDRDEGFFAMGMDSLMSVELKGRLEKRLEMRLPSTLTFNYPSVEAVVGFLEERMQPADPVRQAVIEEASVSPASGPPLGPATYEGSSEDEVSRMLQSRLDRLERESKHP